jgi:glycosyltransferase involved in cell wall biosynthesis
MHLLMVTALDVWSLPGGAGAPTLFRTLRAYADRGHRITLVAPSIGANAFAPGGRLREAKAGSPPDLPGVTFQRFHLPSLQDSRLPLPGAVAKVDQKLRFALLFPRMAARRAQEILDREPVDVLYAYEVHGTLAARKLAERRLPTVARFQGTVMYPALKDRLLRLRRYEEVLALRLQADLYIMTDDGTRGDEVMAALNPRALAKLRFWRNGLDLDRLRPVQLPERRALRLRLGLPDEAFVLLTSSRLAAWKRVDRAIAAVKGVVDAVPNALLVIVGDGEERFNLERQARDLDVQRHVRFVGAVAHNDVPAYAQCADLFLAVADLSNVGNPLLESMACGLPLIAVDAGATNELVRSGQTGELVPSGEPGLIARAIVRLAGDAGQRQHLAEGARHYAETHFWSWDARLRTEMEEVERLVDEPVAASTTARRSAG